ncbi:MAG: hypothetical protein AABO41_03710 [Acidobacteriota bacterium]
MTEKTIERLTAELKNSYQGAVTTKDGGSTLVRLPEVHFAPSCQPESASAMVGFDPAKPKPDFYVKVIPAVRGVQPQHGNSLIGGDNWCTFSYNLSWDEEHTAVQFVEGMLRRFA